MSGLNISQIQIQPISFKRNGAITHPNFKKTSESKPDTVEIKEKEKKSSNTKKLIIGGLILKVAATVIGLRLYRKNYINKAQKTFQEVFMRDNITKEETIEMLKRYKEIKKIKNKDEYMQKLFEEVKKNYGFKDGCLELKTFTNAERKDSGGFVQKLSHFVNINKEQNNRHIFNSMHHEMKHKQQEYFMLNYSGDLKTYLKNVSQANLKDNSMSPEFIKAILRDRTKWLEQFNLKKLDKNNVPEKYREYVEKLLKDVKTYEEAVRTDGKWNKGYYENFLEVDAREAESKIAKLLGGIIPV